ncbi:hypothetical protein J3U65_11290 [Gilliamella sp. B3791]|uniref:hypothetical protein n=4 Tax=Gilliamella TaxID=1193503 RepID=UPI002269A2DD|nr:MULTISPECIES: hypothetical protein [unclassified Gilliamella]MCX8643086.1 hypothetical protein [Gilliamella sp. B3835]MCX8708477.1 hypothetical protein [Gilliamella sp. B3783]MCX8717673.1 hypothetical protein [Gilliamella sp. B3784]MCX8719978.1 hypothetical protein [Gilliamella sp. B3788]MCX8742264.1 hypothetical protein [Gilliamella sp. B3791]
MFFTQTQASGSLSKLALASIPWLLLLYAATTQALSATTAQVIHGSQPYLTSDNGVTKITTTEGLLGITLSDGTRITPSNNTSTLDNPIVLPKENQSFIDIAMLVPPTADAIALNTLIGEPYNYWGDDDGDGQGTNGITATGNLSVRIIDKANQVVSRSATLDICQAPYKLELTTTAGSLTTQYGLPNSRNFSSGTATYYINPKAAPKICYAQPTLSWGGGDSAGPADIWTPGKGFLVQSSEPSSYSRNFPTTGANNLYFDLDIAGVKGSALTWPTVSQGGITATVTPSPDNANNIRVTLTGPVATASQRSSATPGSLATPTLPQTFVLVGKDSSNSEVVSYGFELKQWFVNRGDKFDTYVNTSSWCSNLGGGYRLPQVKDLTNAKCGIDNSNFPCVNGIDGATPASTQDNYQRNIGAGLFTEWGIMNRYTAAGFADSIVWTSDGGGSRPFLVTTDDGFVYTFLPGYTYHGVCAYP